MAKFNYQKAKEAGYSDQEINEFLSNEHPKFNHKKAREAGYSEKEINKFLSSEEPPKKQEEATLKGAVGSYGSGFGGGAGGILPDILNLIKSVPGLTGLSGLLGNPSTQSFTGTHELTGNIQDELGLKDPQNALERILQHSGQFGGQEAIIGTAVGGPMGAGLGALHGTASGAL